MYAQAESELLSRPDVRLLIRHTQAKHEKSFATLTQYITPAQEIPV